MSCSLALMWKSEFFIMVDAARSTVVLDNDSKASIYRCRDKRVEKIRKHGKDLVFVAGAYPCVDHVRDKMTDFVEKDGHINITLLQKYLIDKFPKDKSKLKDTGFSEVSVVVYQVINNITKFTSLQQYDNYNYKPGQKNGDEQNVQLSCNGIHNNVIGGYALNKLDEGKKPFMDIMFDAYQENYCESVGKSVILYHLDNNSSEILKEINLKEINLKYDDEILITKQNLFDSLLQAATGTFGGTVKAGSVESSTIEGSTIKASTINGSTINGSKINSIGNGAGYLSKTQIEEGYIRTHCLKVSPMNVNTQDFSPDSFGYLGLYPSQITLTKDNKMNIDISADGTIHAIDVKADMVNGSLPITFGNMLEYLSDKEHTHPSNTIKPVLTSGGNVGLYGINVASVNYCNQTYATQSSISSLESRVAALEKK